jgi:hypothetical protein
VKDGKNVNPKLNSPVYNFKLPKTNIIFTKPSGFNEIVMQPKPLFHEYEIGK